MENFFSSFVIAVISGIALLGIEYGIIQPLTKRNKSSTSDQIINVETKARRDRLAIVSILFGGVGLFGNVLTPFTIGYLISDGGEWIFGLCIPPVIFSVLGLILGFKSKKMSYRLALSGISVSIVGLSILLLIPVFLFIIDNLNLWCVIYPNLRNCH